MNPLTGRVRSKQSLAASLAPHSTHRLLVPGGEEGEGEPEVTPSPALPSAQLPGTCPVKSKTQGAPSGPQHSRAPVTGWLPVGQSWTEILPFKMAMVGAHVKAVNCTAIWSQEFTCSAAECSRRLYA